MLYDSKLARAFNKRPSKDLEQLLNQPDVDIQMADLLHLRMNRNGYSPLGKAPKCRAAVELKNT